MHRWFGLPSYCKTVFANNFCPSYVQGELPEPLFIIIRLRILYSAMTGRYDEREREIMRSEERVEYSVTVNIISEKTENDNWQNPRV